MPIFGLVGAKNPHLKRPLVAMSLFVGAVVLFGRGFAPNMTVIILFSIFWGIVSAGIFVLGFTIVRDIFDQKRAGTYLGIFGSMVSLGMLIGPFLSGFIMDNFGWRPVFIFTGALMAIAGLLVFFGVKVTREQVQELAVKGGQFDYVGAISITVFLACLVFVLSMTSFFPLGGLVSNILFVVAAIGLVGFIVDILNKKDAAFVPLKVFKDRNSVIFAVCNFLSLFSVMSLMAFLPSYIRAGMGQDPIVQAIGTGLASLLPTTFGAILGLFLGVVFGRMIAKSGTARTVLTIGTVARIVVHTGFLLLFLGFFGQVNYIYICVLMFILGLASIVNNVSYSAGPQIQIDPQMRVQSNSIIQLGQNLGSGVAVPIYTMCIAFATAPLIAEGLDPQVASAMGVVNSMSTMIIIGLVAIVILFFVALLLKPLSKGESPE
jgi:MFS family permease